MVMGRVYLTLTEARHLLPLVEQRLSKLQEWHRQLVELRSVRMREHEYHVETQLFILRVRKKYHYLLFKFYHELEKLLEMGCVMRDIAEGIIDFYSHYHERDIFLCWHVGEDTVSHWHEVTEGFDQRQPVLLLLKDSKV